MAEYFHLEWFIYPTDNSSTFSKWIFKIIGIELSDISYSFLVKIHSFGMLIGLSTPFQSRTLKSRESVPITDIR